MSFEDTRKTEQKRPSFDALVQHIDENSAALDNETQSRVERGRNARFFELDVADETARRPLDRHTVERNGTTLRFVGVAHTPETFLYHRGELEEAVRHAGVIVLEAAPEISGVTSSEFHDRLRTLLAERGLNEDEIELAVSSFADKASLRFFVELEQLAKKHKKPVIIVDPTTSPDDMRDFFLSSFSGKGVPFQEEGKTLAISLFGAGAAIMVAGSAAVASSTVGDMRNNRPLTVDRRKALGIIAAGVGLGLTQSADGASKMSQTAPELSVSLFDYRNVATLRGISQLVQQESIPGPPTFFYGFSHAKPMAHYARSDNTLDIKWRMYDGFRNIRVPRIQMYRYEQEEGGEYAWRRVLDQEVR